MSAFLIVGKFCFTLFSLEKGIEKMHSLEKAFFGVENENFLNGKKAIEATCSIISPKFTEFKIFPFFQFTYPNLIIDKEIKKMFFMNIPPCQEQSKVLLIKCIGAVFVCHK